MFDSHTNPTPAQLRQAVEDRVVLQPRQPDHTTHPVAKEAMEYAADINRITKAHPSLLYAASVIRPSLAMAQGHALSMIQGLSVDVHEFNLSREIAGYDSAMNTMISALINTAQESGMVASRESGFERSGTSNSPATLRVLIREGQVARMIVMFSGSTLIVYLIDQGFERGMKVVEHFAHAYKPREKGFIHHIAYVDNKIESTRMENTDDGAFFDECYPFITNDGGGANNFIDQYMASDVSVLSMFGKPGTGKSTLMRKASSRSQGRYTLLVDNPIFFKDPNAASSLIQYVRRLDSDGKRPLLLLEESDEFVKSKEDNVFLPQLLSLTSGVVSTNVKVMIANNLTDIDKILRALRRGGRTFGNVEFRDMTREEAIKCREVHGLSTDLPPGDTLSLSDVLKTSAININTRKAGMGFVQ